MSTVFNIIALLTVLNFGANNFALAEESKVKYEDMSIEQLMQVPVTVTGSKAKTINQSPGIVTLITSDDIAHMGARDLIDILQTVPGFSTGDNQYNLVDQQFRGLDSEAGKNLFMIDDVPMNENLFQANPLGRRFPVELIDRIEIIRGPGSVRYGGTAELNVVKVVTKLAAHQKSEISGQYGRQEGGTPASQLEGMYFKSGESVNGGALFSVRADAQSERDSTDIDGKTYSNKGNSQINDNFGEAQFSVAGLSAQVLYDKYVVRERYSYGHSLTAPELTLFTTMAGQLSYDLQVSSNFKIRPYINFKHETPWQDTDAQTLSDPNGFAYYREVNHTDGGLAFDYVQSSKLSYSVGLNFYQDAAQDLNNTVFLRDNTLKVTLNGESAYGEAEYDLDWAKLSAGVRYDHGRYGSAFVPRLALVKDSNTLGYKVLLAEAYRPPGVENIEDVPTSQPQVSAETSKIAEVELNGRPTENSFVAVNLYAIRLDNPIVYYNNNSTIENYINSSSNGSHGVELTYQYRNKLNAIRGTGSYYIADGHSFAHGVDGHSQSNLGLENYKLTLQDTVKLSDKSIYVTPAVTYLGPRYSYAYDGNVNNFQQTGFGTTVLANLIFEKRDFLKPDVNLTLGIYNILNQSYDVVSEVTTEGGPIPTQSREYTAKLSATF